MRQASQLNAVKLSESAGAELAITQTPPQPSLFRCEFLAASTQQINDVHCKGSPDIHAETLFRVTPQDHRDTVNHRTATTANRDAVDVTRATDG